MTVESSPPTAVKKLNTLVWLMDAVRWRWRYIYVPRVHHALTAARDVIRDVMRKLVGASNTEWLRVVMDRETEQFVRSLNYSSFDCLEISPYYDKWEKLGFASYRSTSYPEYDVCEGPLREEAFDIIIIQEVLEHVLWPRRAVCNLHKMLKPGGVCVVSAPFMIRMHEGPVDCSRWTEIGIKYLLAEGGFDLAQIKTGSWGNRACLRAHLRPVGWTLWIPWKHSLRNEPLFPISVWAFARKS
jgi:SAM-dependent methyltransferase